ncbi:MAG: asparagine synthase C-terminal domain-containing protein [Thermoplasmatota archaeon]
MRDSGETAEKRLAELLRGSLERSLAGVREAATAFSGGLDSSILAHIASRVGSGQTLYTAGLRGARDIAASRRAASLLGLEGRHIVLEVSEGEVLEAARALRALHPDSSLAELAIATPLFIVCSRAKEEAVVTGDGADELFGGYHRYLSVGGERLEAMLRADLDRLLEGGIERHRTVARSLGKSLLTPYLDEGVIGLARGLPAQEKVALGERKLVLRRAARALGLPEELCTQPKRAAQYGSGAMKALLRLRKVV